MKIQLNIALCLSVLLSTGSVFANPLSLKNVVVAEDRYDGDISRSFPCIADMGVIFCDPTIMGLESACRATLKITNTSLSCKSLSGDFVEFGQISSHADFTDNTQDDYFGYSVKYSDRVTLEAFITPNGNKDLQLIVK